MSAFQLIQGVETLALRTAGARVPDALQLCTRLLNIGDARSLATHAASTTHRQRNAE